MSRLKIAVLCLVLITVPVILESCCEFSGCGCGPKDKGYNIDELSLIITPYPATYPYPVGTAPSPTLKSIAFLVKVDVTRLSSVSVESSGFAAVACDPLPSTSHQTISSIAITSSAALTTVSQTVAAGSSLNDLFSVTYSDNVSTIEGLDGLVGYQHLDTFSVWSDAELNNPQTHTFMITITLDDGRVFDLVTARLELAQG